MQRGKQVASFAASTLLLILTACANEQEDTGAIRLRMANDICRPQNSNVTVQSYVDNRGGIVYGNVTSSAAYRQQPWASSLYVTRSPTFSQTRQGVGVAPFCYGGNCTLVTVPTTYSEDQSLSSVFGLARVPLPDGVDRTGAIEDAELKAEENCQQAADQFARAHGTSAVSRPYTLECVKLTSTVCSF